MYKVPDELEDYLRKLFRGVLTNAQRLSKDAVSLFEQGSYPSAQFLALNSMEEMAKLQEIRQPFIYVRSEEDMEKALGDLASRLADHREKTTTWFRAAPYMDLEDPKEWAHVVDMVSRMVRTWGRDELIHKRLSSISVDSDVSAREIFSPSAAVTRDDAYYFICAAQEMIVDYGDKAVDPFPLEGADPFESFELWKSAEGALKDFMRKHAVR